LRFFDASVCTMYMRSLSGRLTATSMNSVFRQLKQKNTCLFDAHKGFEVHGCVPCVRDTAAVRTCRVAALCTESGTAICRWGTCQQVFGHASCLCYTQQQQLVLTAAVAVARVDRGLVAQHTCGAC
jgi:hypothetical protein